MLLSVLSFPLKLFRFLLQLRAKFRIDSLEISVLVRQPSFFFDRLKSPETRQAHKAKLLRFREELGFRLGQ